MRRLGFGDRRVAGQAAAVAPSLAYTKDSIVTTTGATRDLTGIAAGTDEIHIMLAGVSMTGADNNELILQLGDASSFEATGYTGAVAHAPAGFTQADFAEGFAFTETARFDAATVIYAQAHLIHYGSNLWGFNSVLNEIGGSPLTAAGTKTLTGELTRVRLTTVIGTSTFDLGKMHMASR